MPASRPRERFIPLRKRDVVRLLLEDGGFETEGAKDEFGRFCHMIESIFHFEFHGKLEKLKDSYFPLNPDLKKWREFSRKELDECNRELFDTLKEVLNAANFDPISEEEIAQAYNESAALDVKILVDMDDFESIHFYSQGRRVEEIDRTKLFGLKTVTEKHEILGRVALMVRFKPKEYFESKRSANMRFTPGSTLIKLFKDVPKEDLEILIPNARTSMTLLDTLLLIVPAVVGGVPLLISKVMPALIVVFIVIGAYLGIQGSLQENHLKQAIAACSAGAALGGFCLKQWMKYKNKVYQFQKELSDNLYFRNLVNNVGVFHSLIDSAEEEECKEAFLAYYFLSTSDRPMTGKELDRAVESWFEKTQGIKLDFECDDALGKLERLNLLRRLDDGALEVCSMQSALRKMDAIWDAFFQYNRS